MDQGKFEALATDADADYELQFRGDGQLGVIQIANGVIARIAAMAANEVDGVSLGGKFVLSDLLGRSEGVKGVRVEHVEENRCAISLDVQMAYKTSMSDLAFKLQRHVKEVVERMTGRPVDSVNVVIVGLFEKKTEDDE